MKGLLLSLISMLFFLLASFDDEGAKVSPETQECIDCHYELHPGIVESWKNSRHAIISPEQALKKNNLEKRISSSNVDDNFLYKAVGCYECHSLNTDKHKDSFEHMGYTINIVVSPNDCAVCHAEETEQYSKNLMAHAYDNLMANSLYQDLKTSVNGNYHFSDSDLSFTPENKESEAESCLHCHGTKVEVTGMETRETFLGEMEFPKLKGWPNQGVGRINPDGSKGTCSSCHTRHDFSIETARKPHTCSQCHKGPDVPAYKIYMVSKHGNLYSSEKETYNFDAVPWTVGKDFTSPTCATCHASLIVDQNNTVIADRTHQFNDRLAWRLFGVPYAHPHPRSPEVSKAKNSAGLPLLTELDGSPVKEFVITKTEQDNRDENMQKICMSCHSSSWVDNHFVRIQNTINTTNQQTVTATNMLVYAWEKGLAKGLPVSNNIFDEEIERYWVNTWLFYANSSRLSSAMGGGGDYSVFANGRYQLSNELIKMHNWILVHEKLKLKKK
jgi:hypothetical protein